MRLLRQLPGRIESKVNRRACNLAATPLLSAVKSECPVDEGDLKRSQITKVTNAGGVANAIVGADESYLATDEEGGQRKRPSKYDHLVIFGFQTEGGGHVAGNNYLQRGYDDGIGDARARYESVLADGVQSEAAKLGGK
jgi:hypothetical protein